MLPSELMLARAPSVLIRPVRGLTPAVASPDAPGVATGQWSDPGQWPFWTPRRSCISRFPAWQRPVGPSRVRPGPWLLRTPRVSQPANVWGQTPDMSVTDTDEVQAPRRRRRPCLRAVAPFEQACQLLGRPLEHRPDQRADHVPQEAVGGQLELERVAAPVPDRALDSAREDPVLRLGRRERPEIVPAEQESRRLGKPVLVERPRIPPAAMGLERRGRPAPVDAVAVAPRLS